MFSILNEWIDEWMNTQTKVPYFNLKTQEITLKHRKQQNCNLQI